MAEDLEVVPLGLDVVALALFVDLVDLLPDLLFGQVVAVEVLRVEVVEEELSFDHHDHQRDPVTCASELEGEYFDRLAVEVCHELVHLLLDLHQLFEAGDEAAELHFDGRFPDFDVLGVAVGREIDRVELLEDLVVDALVVAELAVLEAPGVA